jgi:hypothetical protein
MTVRKSLVFPPGSQSMMLTTHPHLLARSKMSRSYTSSPPLCLHLE